MSPIFRYLFPVAVCLVAMFGVADPASPLGVGLLPEAHAIIGRPLTPFSYAGVARRSTYRMVAAETTAVAATAAVATTAAAATAATASAPHPSAPSPTQAAAPTIAPAPSASSAPAGAPPIGAIVNALPAGCVTAPKGGVEYFNCSGVFYRSAFQGNNLVYVVVQP